MFSGRFLCALSVCVLILFVGQAFGTGDPPPYGFKPEYTSGSGASKDRVLLRDVQVLTLYKDKWTNGRRSQAVPQLKCMGGSAGCSGYVPQTVQCYNRGFDGNDVQWECKAEMDKGYKFGEIQVTCEGYDFPDDPYILQGSCGLEYKLEHTNEYSGGGGGYDSYGGYSQPHQKQNGPSPGAGGTGGGSGGGGGGGGGGGSGGGGPPPPGFRPDYSPGSGDSCGGGGYTNQRHYGQGSGQQGPGFWSGMGAGGLLGYMMGNRGGQRGYYNNQPTSSFWGGPSAQGRPSSSFFGGGSGFGGGGGGPSTSSGFGGTRRR